MPSADFWNPQQYNRFRNERRQPWSDLLALVHREEDMRVLDLGCGTGELTHQLHRRLGAQQTLGIDQSPNMLACAEKFASENVSFQEADISTYQPQEPFDVVFSNAALQWVANPLETFAHVVSMVAEHGQIAIQVPYNHDHPTQTTLYDLAESEAFRGSFTGKPGRANFVLPPEKYAELLHNHGFRDQTVRMQVYAHQLENRDEVLQWMAGSLLTDYRRRLDPDRWDDFLSQYRDALARAVPDVRPYFYPFKRILLWGQR